ncbi:hypothetical protein QUA67_00095 [Microcoleus sp. M2_C5]
MFIFKNGIVKVAEAGHLSCVTGTVDFSTSPPTETITHHPNDVIVDKEGWAVAIPINPLVRQGGKKNRRQTVNFKKYDWREASDIKREAEKYGWAEAVKIPC